MACPFCFLSDFVAVAAWSRIQRVDPQMIHFEHFYHQVRRSQFNPRTIFVSLSSWKNIQQGFCTSLQIWDEVGFTWQTKQIVFFLVLFCFFCFFVLTGANFKHSLFMILTELGLLIMRELPRRVSFFRKLLSLKTILAAFFRTFGLLLRFMPSKPSFLHDHFTTNTRISPDF